MRCVDSERECVCTCVSAYLTRLILHLLATETHSHWGLCGSMGHYNAAWVVKDRQEALSKETVERVARSVKLCLCHCLSLSVRRLGLGICPSTSQSHTHTHSLSLVLVVMMKSKELKTKISHAHSLILSQCVESSRSILMLILRFSLTVSVTLCAFLTIPLSLSLYTLHFLSLSIGNQGFKTCSSNADFCMILTHCLSHCFSLTHTITHCPSFCSACVMELGSTYTPSSA